MKTATIGFWREDGDFQVLASFNNNDDIFSEAHFDKICLTAMDMFAGHDPHNPDAEEREVFIYERQDLPDYISGFDVCDEKHAEIVNAQD